MSEKVQNVMKKIDSLAEISAKLPQKIDQLMLKLKDSNAMGIPLIVSKFLSKFSGLVFMLLTILFIVFCLKTFIVSLAFKDIPRGMLVTHIFFAVGAVLVSSYVFYKMEEVFERIIKSSQCRISSLNIFSILSFFCWVLAAILLLNGVYLGITAKSFFPTILGVAFAAFFVLLAFFNASPEEFAITIDEKASAGEDWITLMTFVNKIILRLVPIAIFIYSCVGIYECLNYTFSSCVVSNDYSSYFDIRKMIYNLHTLRAFLWVGVLPLVAYVVYLVNYLCIDIIRIILSLPQKMDELKK